MVDIIRRKNIQVQAEDVSSAGKARVDMLNQIGSAAATVGKAVSEWDKNKQKEKAESESYKAKVENNIKVSQQKAFDASDKLIAADMAGRLENDLLRWNLEQRQNNPNYIGSPDHEKAMRDYYAKLSEKYSQGLGEVGKGEFTSKTQNAVNQMIGNDVKWAYQQKIKQGEESAKNIAQSMNDTAGMYGANGDIQGFKESHKEKREQLQEYAENAMPAGAQSALYEADKKSVVNLLTGMAETDPQRAKNILENPELFKEVLPEGMVDNVNNIETSKKMRELNDELVLVNAGIANEKDKKEKRKLEKAKDKIEKEIKDTQDKDFTDDSISSINKEVKETVSKTIDYNINLQKQIEESSLANEKLGSAMEFMDNPIIYKANMDRVNVKTVGDIPESLKMLPMFNRSPAVEDMAKKIYGMSDKVGDGNVSPADLDKIVKKVASITVGDNGSIDDNILKAFQGDLALREAGASPSQLETYHRMTELAMTDTSFKQGVAALANKPSFDSMLFLQNPSRAGGLAFFTRTVKDDDVQYVENMGRQAYFEAMNTMSQPNLNEEQRKQAVAEALSTYDRRIAEAYDFIKRDVVDVDYVNKQLAKMGSAMVELNGNMTKIVGRLPNGEYIIESTGEKVDAKF